MRVSFEKFRSAVLDQAKHEIFKTSQIKYDLKTPAGSDCISDYIWKKSSSENLLFVLAGTHGIESYLGSLIFQKIFSEFESNFWERSPNIVFVHALNAYGMAWLRRANFQNVDLNRNGSGRVHERDPEFEKVRSIFKIKNNFSRRLNMTVSLPKLWVAWGAPKILQVTCRGQSDYPDELFYTGTEYQNEIKNLFSFALSEFKTIKKIWILDFHTGLGAPMQESLITETTQPQNQLLLAQLLGHHCVNPQKEKYLYSVNGLISEAFRQHYPNCEVNYICAEYGTVGPLKVIQTLLAENHFFQKNKNTLDVKIHSSMLDCFFPASKAWQQVCTQYGFQVFLKLFRHLSL